MAKVLYPESFNPITKEHMNIIEQASNLFDEVIITVMHNPSKNKSMFSANKRLEMITRLYEKMNNIKVIIASSTAVDVAFEEKN